jgi:hypothetical protein
MIYIKYILLMPISLVITLLALIFAPVMVLFTQQKDGWLDNGSMWGIGPRLPTWLNWFMTPDNSLEGDGNFLYINGFGYWSKAKWLWRNPAYSFALRYIPMPYTTSVSGDPTIKDNDNAKEGWCLVVSNGLFQLRYVKRIFSTSRCLYCNFGWNIMGLADPNVMPKPLSWEATFVFSPRISGFR